MHYYLYEIKNNINGKIYVGVHKTKVLDDGYMGSGKVIKSAIKKYGLENFTKIILEQFDNQEAMFAREKEIVNEEFLAREDVYNLRRGGHGGFDYINSLETKSDTSRKAIRAAHVTWINRYNTDIMFKRHISKISSDMMKETHKLGKISYDNFKGKTHTKETIELISQKAKINSSGEKNSQAGTMWITNGTENKKIKKDAFIPEGWNKGRKIIH